MEHDMPEAQELLPKVVLDTNIVLDIWLYQDPATPILREALENRRLQWLVTNPMREELLRVLHYPHIAVRMQSALVSVDSFMAVFDEFAHMQAVAIRAPYVCKDADDQKFIDLAVANTALLLSKDKQVLKLTGRLARLGVSLSTVYKSAHPN
jgi:putative PIN family toxin of toxin-antitoxin system